MSFLDGDMVIMWRLSCNCLSPMEESFPNYPTKARCSLVDDRVLLPRPDRESHQGDAVRLVRGGHVHEGDDAPVHVLLRVEQCLRGQPERAGRSLIDRIRDRIDARRLGALDIGRNRGGGQLQHVLAGRGIIQRTQRQGARTLVDADPLVLRPVALEHRVPLVLAPRCGHRGARGLVQARQGLDVIAAHRLHALE